MLERSRDILRGAEVIGTGQAIEVGKKKTNPTQFSYDYQAPSTTPDGDVQPGRAKVFIPSEGERVLLGETPETKKDYLGTLIGQVLKIHQKGQRALEAQATGGVVASKAGKLSEASKARLEAATSGVVDTLLARIAAYDAGYDYDEVEEPDARAVADWVGCDAENAEHIIRDLTGRILADRSADAGEER